MRARVPADQVSVIPNATDTTLFVPDPTKRDKDQSIYVCCSKDFKFFALMCEFFILQLPLWLWVALYIGKEWIY